MKLSKLIKTRKYLLQIYFAITLVTVLIVTVVIWSIYYAIKGNILDIERKTSIEMLTQIKNNTNFIQQTSTDMCFSIFRNSDVQSLLYQKDSTEYELMIYINRLSDGYLSTNPSIHSIYVYNSAKDEYYSTNNGIHNVDDDFMKAIEENRFNSNFTPTVRNIGDEAVVTFSLVENYGNMDNGSAIYVNMRFDWLMNYLDTVNRIGEVQSGSLFVFDENDNCINTYIDPDSAEESSAILSMFDTLNPKQPVQLFDVKISNVDYTATLLKIDSYDWKLVRIYPYDELLGGVNQIRLYMLLFNIIAVVTIMLLVMLLAKRIYQPVDTLIKHIDMPLDSDTNITEFERLEQSYLFSKEELRQLEKEKEMQGILVREYALKKLFSAEHLLTREELKRLSKEHQIMLSFETPISIILLKIEDFSRLNKDYNPKSDRSLVLFGIINIISEIFSEKYVCECISINESCIALLYGTLEGEDDKLSTQLLKKAEGVIMQLFSLSFSCSIEEGFDAVNLPSVYERGLNSINDRFMLGEGCIITRAVHERAVGQMFVDYSFDEEVPFLDSLSQMKLEAAQKSLDKLITKIKALDYQSACVATSHLTNSIQQTIFEINKYRKEPIVAMDYSQYWEQAPSITLDQYHGYINAFLEDLQQSYLHGSSKHQIVAETIKDYIDKMYDNYDLSAATIADMLKISSAHTGRVFNQHMGMSVPEYINCVRLKKAMEWMQNSDFTIQEIMSKVGYQNESYFYKVFKERFNLTPRSYVKSLRKKN